MITQDDMHAILANARAASRWTVAYAQLLLGYVRAFEDGLCAATNRPFSFTRWGTDRHAGPPNPGTSPHGRWTWDYFPLLAPTFRWRTDGDFAVGSAQVDFRVALDGGWPYANPGGEPDPHAFPDPATCGSPVVVTGWVVRHVGQPTNWDEATAIADAVQHPEDGQVHEHADRGLRMRMRQLHLDLADLPDRAALETRVIAPLVELWPDGNER